MPVVVISDGNVATEGDDAHHEANDEQQHRATHPWHVVESAEAVVLLLVLGRAKPYVRLSEST